MLKYTKVRNGGGIHEPKYPGDVGYDLLCSQDATIPSGVSMLIPTGVAIECPDGFFARIVGRSSAAAVGLDITEGIIDNGFRGELMVRARNHADHDIQVRAGDRLAQLILGHISVHALERVESLSPTTRGTNGFGSTGAAPTPSRPGWLVVDEYTNGDRPSVYLGGAVDMSAGDHLSGWRHTTAWPPGFYPVCPVCTFAGLPPSEIYGRSLEGARAADAAVFYLDGTVTLGTPIEIHTRINAEKWPTILVIPDLETFGRSVFIKTWQDRGAVVVRTVEGAAAYVGAS